MQHDSPESVPWLSPRPGLLQEPDNAHKLDGAKLKVKVLYMVAVLSCSLLVFIPVIDQTAEDAVLSLLSQFIEHGNKLIHLDTASHP